MGESRKLTAILAADVVGYSRLAGADEDRTLARLRALRSDLIDPTIAVYHGRVVKRTGDGALVEFRSVVDAVRCAVEVQNAMLERNAGVPPDRRIEFRIGIHIGDIVEESDGDLMGDGVNIAARLEGIAEPNGICLSGAAYEQVRDKLKHEFEDLGDKELKNIARPVRAFRVVLNPDTARGPIVPALSDGKLALPDKPPIAVLAFQNISGDPEQEYFVDGMVEEITTALSRMRWLFVIARNSSYAFKGRIVDAREIGRALGVRYLLEGSVRRAGGRIRLAGQLIDAESGSQLWADRYDGDLADIFDLQDRITEHVVGAIQPSILSAEVERARRKRPESLDAYDLVLRAFPLVWSLDKDQNETARSLLAQALAHDVDYPFALSLLAWCHAQRAVYGWTDAPGRDRDEGLRLAQRAASLSHDDPMVLAILGAAHSFARDFDVAETHLERARSLDPNSAWAWLRSGWLDVYRERSASALGHFARFRRLSPLDPIAYMADVGVGAAHFVDGRYDDAITWIQRGLSQQPDASWALRWLVSAYVHAGRLDEARRACLRLRESHPDLTLAKVRDTWWPSAIMARILSGLRDAGLPEG